MKTFFRSRKVWAVAGAAALVALVAVGCGYRPGGRAPAVAGSTEGSSPLPGSSRPASPPAECPIQLVQLGAETGISFRHTDGSSGRRYIVEPMSAGLALFDYDGDGLIDVYFCNGAPLPGTKVDKPPRHALYKNLGGWRFEDVTEEAGIACTRYGLGVAVGDYDNDGHADVYLDNFGPNVLYRNLGNGAFAEVTREAGLVKPDEKIVGAGACFLDVDGDGELDLYVGNYMELDCDRHRPRVVAGFPSYPQPREYDPVPDILYRNTGRGTFTDASRESGIAAHAGRSMGMTCADYDNDGDTDVFVCNDVQENFLFRNDGCGNFEQVGVLVGVALNANGETLANMGVDSGDYDNDGWLDFFTTNYQSSLPILFHNVGKGMFDDVTTAANAGAGCLPYVNWGSGLVDFDNDGYRDLFIANGHTEDNVELRDRSTTYREPNVLLRNTGRGRFVNVSDQCGDGLRPVLASRGAAFGDLDNDGDVDAVILNSREKPTILRNMLNELGSANHWLQVRLRGVKTNRDGVGARVKVVTKSWTQIDEVHSGRGYQSHWGSRLCFGLGGQDRVERIEVRWIGGGTDVLVNVPVDRLLTVTEGNHPALEASP